MGTVYVFSCPYNGYSRPITDLHFFAKIATNSYWFQQLLISDIFKQVSYGMQNYTKVFIKVTSKRTKWSVVGKIWTGVFNLHHFAMDILGFCHLNVIRALGDFSQWNWESQNYGEKHQPTLQVTSNVCCPSNNGRLEPSLLQAKY